MKQIFKTVLLILGRSIMAIVIILPFALLFGAINRAFAWIGKLPAAGGADVAIIIAVQIILGVLAAAIFACCYLSPLAYIAITTETETILPRMAGIRDLIDFLRDKPKNGNAIA